MWHRSQQRCPGRSPRTAPREDPRGCGHRPAGSSQALPAPPTAPPQRRRGTAGHLCSRASSRRGSDGRKLPKTSIEAGDSRIPRRTPRNLPTAPSGAGEGGEAAGESPVSPRRELCCRCSSLACSPFIRQAGSDLALPFQRNKATILRGLGGGLYSLLSPSGQSLSPAGPSGRGAARHGSAGIPDPPGEAPRAAQTARRPGPGALIPPRLICEPCAGAYAWELPARSLRGTCTPPPMENQGGK